MPHIPVTSQDPSGHLFYDVDWTSWLANRGLSADDIDGFTWEVPTPAVKTNDTSDGAVARVYIKDVPLNETLRVVCTISVVNPDAGDPITDVFSFTLTGSLG